MVVRANREHPELGGHIASYASAADLFEVGFNHFFRAGQDGDLVYFQPHSAPGVYARAFLEGRLTEEQLANYRRETGGKGLSSYPHPWLMPDFWQFPTGSMGLGPITAIYQARFMRYLEDRGVLETAARKVWAFVGDGEMDEPESLAGLSLAAREGLDNLIFVVNCNLQRLDGPVRGNGSIVQELEGLFAGAGWNVIKLLWGSRLGPAVRARRRQRARSSACTRRSTASSRPTPRPTGAFNREHFFNKYPELQALVAHLSDDDIDRLRRGGHDPVKIYAAYHAAVAHTRPADGHPRPDQEGLRHGALGPGPHEHAPAEEARRRRAAAPSATASRCRSPTTTSTTCASTSPAGDSAGDALPARAAQEARRLPAGAHRAGAEARGARARGVRAHARAARSEREAIDHHGVRAHARRSCCKDAALGKRIVPIVADEARTFGMQTLFRQVGIYSPIGQLYEPEDRDELLYYKEAKDGQILEEGINEAGAISSWIAAATSYCAHGVPMLPFYIYYSMFGFQRVGDLIWAAADSRSRGFLIGATAGRTTLSGEGLQHQDGSSHLVASTIPNCRAYDPVFRLRARGRSCRTACAACSRRRRTSSTTSP